MYEQYWGLQAKPFDNAVDDRFFFPAESHEGALLKLRYAIENRRGAALLTGAAGLGKTLLVNRLFSLLDDTINPRVHVVFPKMETLQLMNFLGSMIAGDAVNQHGLDQSIQVLQNFLAHNSSEGYHTVVAIDEAHLLNDSDTFESLRLLLNFQSTGQYDLSLLFVGQPRIINTLQRVNGMDDRVAVKCLLRALSRDETEAYIQHRLEGAQATRKILADDAIDEIYQQTMGVPSRINRLCDLALLIGFADELSEIDADHLDAVAREIVTIGAAA